MEEPRIVQLPAYRVVKLRYQGPPPPAREFLDHWRLFMSLAERAGVRSQAARVQAIGYAPPLLGAYDVLVYDSCLPVADDFDATPLVELDVGVVPGGRYVLCAGPVTELPDLLQEAKRYAMAHGLAIERGRIEIYRPIAPGDSETPVDVGYRIHD
jgi:DNA gyrase inhibitor GyrI